MKWWTVVAFCISLSLRLDSSHADFEDMMRQQGGKKCRAFSCPNGDQEPVPKRKLALQSTGCAGMSGGNMFSMSQQSSDSEDVLTTCCDQRNACL
jgi:hypothetical protein